MLRHQGFGVEFLPHLAHPLPIRRGHSSQRVRQPATQPAAGYPVSQSARQPANQPATISKPASIEPSAIEPSSSSEIGGRGGGLKIMYNRRVRSGRLNQYFVLIPCINCLFMRIYIGGVAEIGSKNSANRHRDA